MLGRPIDDDTAQRALPVVVLRPNLGLLHRTSRFSGVVVDHTGTDIVVKDARGMTRRFRNEAGAFLVEGTPVRLVDASTPALARPDHLTGARVTGVRTASGSRTVVGARARVARPARILVEGVHDAELVEQVWGDDLRLEGVVVERLDGADRLVERLRALEPGPGRRVGVLLDHLVPGSKESRLAAATAHPCVLVTGTPYVDVWQAVRPDAVGIVAWPEVPLGVDWKTGVSAALGFSDPHALWRKIRDSVHDWTHLEQPLVRAVEELIDFVTGDEDERHGSPAAPDTVGPWD